MKLTNRSGRIRLGVALSATALAFAGSLANVATPAQADEPNHCVVTVPETQVRCFATYEEARAFVASVAETGPGKTPSAAAQRAYGEALVLSPVWLFTAYDLANYNSLNGSVFVIGLNGPCTTTIADLDYSMPTLGGLDNIISSYQAGSNCWLNLFRDPFFGGPSTGYRPSSPVIANGLNNMVSSIKIS